MKDLIYKRKTMTGAILTLLMIIAAALPVMTYASENIPVITDIKITYIVDGNVKTAGGDSFTLTADDPQSPMPDGTTGGEKTITISDEGSYSFGDIYYDRPDVYWYTVRRDVTEKKGVVKDDSVFKAKVIALNDGHGYVLVYKNGSSEKEELIYKDRVAPDTGEDGKLLFYSVLAAVAAAALAVFAAAANRDRRRSSKRL